MDIETAIVAASAFGSIVSALAATIAAVGIWHFGRTMNRTNETRAALGAVGIAGAYCDGTGARPDGRAGSGRARDAAPGAPRQACRHTDPLPRHGAARQRHPQQHARGRDLHPDTSGVREAGGRAGRPVAAPCSTTTGSRSSRRAAARRPDARRPAAATAPVRSPRRTRGPNPLSPHLVVLLRHGSRFAPHPMHPGRPRSHVHGLAAPCRYQGALPCYLYWNVYCG